MKCDFNKNKIGWSRSCDNFFEKKYSFKLIPKTFQIISRSLLFLKKKKEKYVSGVEFLAVRQFLI